MRLANGGEPADVIPVILVPVEVQVPLRVVPVEIGHVADTTRDATDRAERDDRELPLEFPAASVRQSSTARSLSRRLYRLLSIESISNFLEQKTGPVSYSLPKQKV